VGFIDSIANPLSLLVAPTGGQKDQVEGRKTLSAEYEMQETDAVATWLHPYSRCNRVFSAMQLLPRTPPN